MKENRLNRKIYSEKTTSTKNKKATKSGSLMSDKRDSNPRPSAWEANALPTELLSRNGYKDTIIIHNLSSYPCLIFTC